MIDRELGTFVETVEDRIQNAILSAIDSIITPIFELAIRSTNASSEGDASSFIASLERGEHQGTTAPLEDVSERNNKLHVSKINDEARNKIPDVVSELSVPDTQCDRQLQTHHMVTRQTTQTNPIPKILTGWTLTSREQQSHPNQTSPQ